MDPVGPMAAPPVCPASCGLPPPPTGPAVRCKLDLMIWRRLVLRFCIRPLNGAASLLAIMDIRAHPISFSERPWRVRRRDRFPTRAQIATAGPSLANALFFDFTGKPMRTLASAAGLGTCPISGSRVPGRRCRIRSLPDRANSVLARTVTEKRHV